MKQILIDTNIILDIALQREPFFEIAYQIFSKIDEGKIKGFVTASSVTDIYYVSQKECGREKTFEFIREMVDILDVLSVTKETIINALETEFKDFEDAVQYCTAYMNCIEIIATMNKSDFKHSVIEVCTTEELLKKLSED
ncbi:MAG: PIN domain-containing protein [Marinilabiliaceae bacterium]|nr:PIN domain-containing protein [Marinilabiliaceae bacterium]